MREAEGGERHGALAAPVFFALAELRGARPLARRGLRRGVLLAAAVAVAKREAVVPLSQIFEQTPVLILVQRVELLHAPESAPDQSLLGNHAGGEVFGVRTVRETSPIRVLLSARVGVDLILQVVRSERRVVVGIDGQLDGGVAAVVQARAPSGVPEGLRPDRGVHLRRRALHGSREGRNPAAVTRRSDQGNPRIRREEGLPFALV